MDGAVRQSSDGQNKRETTAKGEDGKRRQEASVNKSLYLLLFYSVLKDRVPSLSRLRLKW